MSAEKPGGRWKALRHLLVFQLKLAADALRDFVLSPLSILAFLVDTLADSPQERALYPRLMRLGRRSDRVINLFDEYGTDEDYSIDRAVDEVESFIRAGQVSSRDTD